MTRRDDHLVIVIAVLQELNFISTFPQFFQRGRSNLRKLMRRWASCGGGGGRGDPIRGPRRSGGGSTAPSTAAMGGGGAFRQRRCSRLALETCT